MHALSLHMAIAARDYSSSNLMSYSGGTPTSPFAAMGSHCQEHSCSMAIFCYNSKKILSCEFRIHLTARIIQLQDYINGEASIMFRT